MAPESSLPTSKTTPSVMRPPCRRRARRSASGSDFFLRNRFERGMAGRFSGGSAGGGLRGLLLVRLDRLDDEAVAHGPVVFGPELVVRAGQAQLVARER